MDLLQSNEVCWSSAVTFGWCWVPAAVLESYKGALQPSRTGLNPISAVTGNGVISGHSGRAHTLCVCTSQHFHVLL